MNEILRNLIKKMVLYSSLFSWILFWGYDTLDTIIKRIPYYTIAATGSLDQLHEMKCVYDENSQDYYKIIEFCNKVIPGQEKIKLVLPQEIVHKYEFLREKGRYFLYPRNYGNNEETANYILIYGVKDYEIPDGYERKIVFGEDKFLIVKKGCRISGVN